MAPKQDHTGSNGRYNHGCRCSACREAHRAHQAVRRLNRRAYPIPLSVRHGTHAAYVHWFCRCDPCRAAHSAALRQYRAKGKAGA